MAESVDQPSVENAVLIFGVKFDAFGEVHVAVEACGFLQDCAEHGEMIGTQPVILVRLPKFDKRCHMVENWRAPGLGQEKRV